MAFYDLAKPSREKLVLKITDAILRDIKGKRNKNIVAYFQEADTYIRKSAYLSIGKIYLGNVDLQQSIIKCLTDLRDDDDFKIRQTVINSAGEIGKKDFEAVRSFFDAGLFDKHHSPRNAVIGCIKKMGEVNPKPVLKWATYYLHHADKEIRREICHGIELRGRKFPQDILPLLKELQHDNAPRIRNTLVHVLGQIAYKKGCLETVVGDLKTWNNKELVDDALNEIIDVHERYKNFAIRTQKEAIKYITKNYRRGN